MALAGDGRELIAVGDPDQSIYAFRGADVRALTGSRGSAARTAARPGRGAAHLPPQRPRPAGRVPPGGAPAPGRARGPRRPGPAPAAGAHAGKPSRRDPHPDRGQLDPGGRGGRRHPAPCPPGRRGALAGHGRPGPLRHPAGAAAAPGADRGRRAGRGGRGRAAAGRRARRPAAADPAPLRREPDPRSTSRPRPSSSPGRWAAPTPSACAACAGPAAARRRRPRGRHPAHRRLLAHALLDPPRPGHGAGPGGGAGPAPRQTARHREGRRSTKGGSAEDVLWAIWAASGLAAQWQQASAAGGAAGAAADRDLDAVLPLFDTAARFTDRLPPGAPALFPDSLSGQEIAGDTLAERAVRDDCVRVLTAHRPRAWSGTWWWSPGVQEETWPDLRMRGSLLGVDELAEAASGPGGEAAWTRPCWPPSCWPRSGGSSTSPSPGREAARRYRGRRRGHRPAAVPVPDRAGGRRHRDRAGRRAEPAGCRCPRWSPTCAGPRPTPRVRPPSGRPRRPSWPGWPPPGSARPTRASGTR